VSEQFLNGTSAQQAFRLYSAIHITLDNTRQQTD